MWARAADVGRAPWVGSTTRKWRARAVELCEQVSHACCGIVVPTRKIAFFIRGFLRDKSIEPHAACCTQDTTQHPLLPRSRPCGASCAPHAARTRVLIVHEPRRAHAQTCSNRLNNGARSALICSSDGSVTDIIASAASRARWASAARVYTPAVLQHHHRTHITCRCCAHQFIAPRPQLCRPLLARFCILQHVVCTQNHSKT